MYTDPWRRKHRYAPPAGWAPKDGNPSFFRCRRFGDECRRDLEFPKYRGPSGLRGVRGDCLEPLVTQRHILHVRPVRPDELLIDGGLYTLELGESAQSSEAIAYREKWGVGAGEAFVITKFAR